MLTRRRPRGFWALAPFGELQDEITRFFGDEPGNGHGQMLSYRVDVREDNDHVFVEAELPGMTKDDIDITLENGVMTISGEKKLEQEEKKENFYVAERRYGKFSRSFQLPSVVDESKVEATLKDGVLHITLNKREEVKPRRIEVKVK